MPRRPPGAKQRGLGAELRAIREQAGLSVRQAATRINWDKGVLSRLENGHRNISTEDVATLLACYDVTSGDVRDRLVNMARTINEPGWWEIAMPGLPSESATLADYEERADRMTVWSPMLIPGMMQSMEYGRAVMRADDIDPNQVELRLTARLRRQHRLTDPNVQYTALIGEPALHGPLEARQFLADQLRAVEAVGKRPNVSVRIVPTERIPSRARLSMFVLLQFPTARDVVHVELMRSGVFLDEPPLTDPYLDAVTNLKAVALSETESARWCRQLTTEMEP